jgi:heparan-alpha-glucosaminide N-acetyltransferase
MPVPAARVRSVDALRGLVVALMIVVNTLADVPRVPWFTQHLPASVDGYSLADMIFPWFLFLVGVSLPLSLGHFVRDGRRTAALARVIPRVAGLALLGVIFVNAESIAPGTGLTETAWFLLTTTAMMALLVIRAPTAAPRPRSDAAARAAKIAAAVALVVLLAIYRGRGPGDSLTWLRPRWWGILGIIGWSYLVGALAFLATRGQRLALAGLLGLSIAVALGSAQGRMGPLSIFEPLFGVHEFLGSYACLVIAGAIAGSILSDRDDQAETAPAASAAPRIRRARQLAQLGGVLWLAGWFLRPLHGYHKMGGSESWALVAAGQAALLLALLHLLLDRRDDDGRPRANGWLADAGSNALLAYLLSEIQAPLCERLHISLTPANTAGGPWALVNAAALSAGFIALAALATRARVRLRL